MQLATKPKLKTITIRYTNGVNDIVTPRQHPVRYVSKCGRFVIHQRHQLRHKGNVITRAIGLEMTRDEWKSVTAEPIARQFRVVHVDSGLALPATFRFLSEARRTLEQLCELIDGRGISIDPDAPQPLKRVWGLAVAWESPRLIDN
jgi:hypothetical protein